MLAQDTHKSLYALKSTYILPVEEHASPQHADLISGLFQLILRSYQRNGYG